MAEPASSHTQPLIRHEPGVPVIHGVNWSGMKALYLKEVRRFLKVHLQTIWGPALTSLLFLIIFTVALGRGGLMVMGVPFADFVAPGLIIMAMVQNSFQNTATVVLAGKLQGTIVDYLMPPFSAGELLFALVAASVTRAAFVGGAIWLAMLAWPGVHVAPHHLWAVVYFGIAGSAMLGFLGILTGIWAEKFDHAAAVTNFLVAPLSLLSGTFYSMDHVSPIMRAISHVNPFFYAISGFRYGFLAAADSPIAVGAALLLALNLVLAAVCYIGLRQGWRIKS
ncbi:ABC-2 type transport system permease protein [Sphingobium sp. B2D3A]|uniref:ABC transporter permease n=1 Tax=Sphingobium TaxID=165695 RepID=UPI0015EC40F5|nr:MULTISPECIES: ABC transporter permease [Sphingobium]MCW2338896.1 ABC-2 type transport system permease protein [Sphingobium sp. B2D3A]MCW2349718.1 ABC-2 type transport system permease protein [Sphingobium sp. B12D2B]MCW2364360.1 ABC-2 type transport system permease protein [Sphingobium sp. B10D3B]MCW2368822.1 ABC-2 type transport system permease protein [Sphingobium sp. B11D3D]MCW2382468.1 ABC-2 type transport system permease protein [Sphingobium sp. B2D3B]